MSSETSIAILIMLIGVLVYYCKDNKQYFIGYRTPSSMKNAANWKFAQIYSAIRIIVLGVLLLVGNLLANLCKLSESHIELFNHVGIGIGLLLIIVSTERALSLKNKS